MKPSELYKRKPEKETRDINLIINHLPEAHEVGITPRVSSKNNKILIKLYKDYNFNHNFNWCLMSVWLEDNPVMIIQEAGKYGKCHEKIFVTNKELYIEMIDYVNYISAFEDVESYDENNDIPNLDCFYGHNLDDKFEEYE